jgi:hypothetical protein
MSLDRQLWEDLQAHGITESYLVLLLRLLEIQRNGSWTWHYTSGKLTLCDARVTFAAREGEVAHMTEALREGGVAR